MSFLCKPYLATLDPNSVSNVFIFTLVISLLHSASVFDFWTHRNVAIKWNYIGRSRTSHTCIASSFFYGYESKRQALLCSARSNKNVGFRMSKWRTKRRMGRNVNCIVEIQKDSKFAVSISKKKTRRKKKQEKKKQEEKKCNKWRCCKIQRYKGTLVYKGSTNATRRLQTKNRSQ